MSNKIAEMFQLQNQLNINTNGKDWLKGYTKENREIDWYRCIYMETAEAIDSLNWKHWKNINTQDDLQNLKIEIVDIWHFLMSQIIKEQGLKQAIDYFEAILHKEKLEKTTNQSLLITLEKLLLSSTQRILEKTTQNFIEIINHKDYQDQWNFDELYLLYIGKNCLNQFRQDNGYKTGNYTKNWNAKEDNVYMQNFLEKQKNIDYKTLYKYLEKEYKKIVKS